MNGGVKIFLWSSATIVLLLLAVWLVVVLFGGKAVMSSHEVFESFNRIQVATDTADVRFALSEDGTCRVVCHERERATHAVEVVDGCLTVSLIDERMWYDHINFSLRATSITVYLPRSEYDALSVKIKTGDVGIPKGLTLGSVAVTGSTGDVECHASVTGLLTVTMSTGDIALGALSAGAISLTGSTGDVELSDITCRGEIDITLTTGDIELSKVTCQALTSTGSTGDVELSDVLVSEHLSVERSTGNVALSFCDAGTISIVTKSGSVRGSLLSEKVFIAKTNTGRVDVPRTERGGRCEISTSTGSIRITICEG